MKRRSAIVSAVSLALLLVVLAVGCGGPSAAPAGKGASADLRWFGQSAFLLTSSQGTRILIDPPSAATGYAISPIDGVDAVLVTHEHSDHNNVSVATGSPLVVRGLSSTGWNSIDQKVKDVRVYSVSPAQPVYHDNQQGKQRGRNTIFVIEVDGMRLAQLGDLGHVLTTEIVKAMGAIDVLIVPVGGNFTIDAANATQVVGQLSPKVVVPMHFKTPKMRADWPGAGVEPFLEGKKVERPNSTSIKLSRSSLPSPTTVMVLNYE
ncbi:MAG: MBL fold metallo-hydrolase [Chloroflexi bacterium]|nr:MBL fold metallo-hydrolase [Chloroflexota bacterium]